MSSFIFGQFLYSDAALWYLKKKWQSGFELISSLGFFLFKKWCNIGTFRKKKNSIKRNKADNQIKIEEKSSN